MNQPALIDIHNATIWRGRTRVLSNFSLRINQDEHVAILGPNGAGKTTLLKTITRELRPVASENSYVRILGCESWNIWELRKQIGLVSHDLQADFSKGSKAQDVVASGYFSSVGLDSQLRSRLLPAQYTRVQKVMQMLGIEECQDRPFRTLSTGQQRRCLLGRALVHKPRTLVFDEPTSGLDLAASFDLLHRVSGLVKAGCSLVWVTHHLNDIPPEIERVIVLRNGEVFADGNKHEVLNTDLISEVFETRLEIFEKQGFYFSYPADH